MAYMAASPDLVGVKCDRIELNRLWAIAFVYRGVAGVKTLIEGPDGICITSTTIENV